MAAEQQSAQQPMLKAHHDAPLIGLLNSHDEDTAVAYYTDEAAADEAITDNVVQNALALAGAWADVPWDELVAGLDRIRHESEPTPPINL